MKNTLIPPNCQFVFFKTFYDKKIPIKQWFDNLNNIGKEVYFYYVFSRCNIEKCCYEDMEVIWDYLVGWKTEKAIDNWYECNGGKDR